MENQKTLLNSSLSFYLKFALYLIATCFLILAIASCNNSTDSESNDFNVQTTMTSSQGEVLADGEGNILYYFTPDVEGNSTCEGDCIGAWPVFHVEALDPDEGLEPADFGTTTRPDGSSQTTYLGWPLYYFSGDQQPGDVNGEAIESFGGFWYVAKPGYTIMRATQQLVGHDGLNYVIDENGNYSEGEGITTHFTDGNGRTLYTFQNDSANTNNFTEEDFSNNDLWPIFEESLAAIPSSLNSTHFGTIDVFGRTQLTYKGWPLYHFGQDAERGETQGISFPDEADPGLWPVAQLAMEAAPGYTVDDGDDGNGDNTDY